MYCAPNECLTIAAPQPQPIRVATATSGETMPKQLMVVAAGSSDKQHFFVSFILSSDWKIKFSIFLPGSESVCSRFWGDLTSTFCSKIGKNQEFWMEIKSLSRSRPLYFPSHFSSMAMCLQCAESTLWCATRCDGLWHFVCCGLVHGWFYVCVLG